MNNTINYYNQNAENFIANTQNADMHPTQERFLRLLDANTSILDFGCGSGRDAKYKYPVFTGKNDHQIPTAQKT